MPAALSALLLFAAQAAAAPDVAAVGAPRTAALIFSGPKGDLTVPCELACEPAAHARGLMHRTTLPADAGMLFVFGESAVRRFWMKDTPLPLDMIFLDPQLRVVGIVANATPFSHEARGVTAPARYVLEVHAGFAARHHLALGSRARLAGTMTGCGG